ncbi:MAG: hypothetical protein ACI97A_004028 [Planctomycetota bacterium]|jgi:hypothetical protein
MLNTSRAQLKLAFVIAVLCLSACVGPTPEANPYGTLQVDDSHRLHAIVRWTPEEIHAGLKRCSGAQSLEGRFLFDGKRYQVVIEAAEIYPGVTRISFAGSDRLGRAPHAGFLGPWSRAILDEIEP